jgi:hypothetical protein
MPTEIADSDGEAELDSPAKVEQLLPKHPPQTQQSAASNDLGVHLSDFLSQEQHLHEQWHLRSPNLQQTTNHAGLEPGELFTGVGDELVQEEHLPKRALTAIHGGANQSELAAVETTPTMSRKRRHTPWDDGEDAGGSDQMSQKRQRKSRVRTYGNSSDRMRSSQPQASNDTSGDATQAWEAGGDSGDMTGQVSSVFALAETQGIFRTDVPMQPPPSATYRAIEGDESPRQRNRPRRVLSLIEESLSDASREISTSRSSMGNYESVNIDFRGTANGRDVGTNPFGRLSQTSADDEVRDADPEKMSIESDLDSLHGSALLHAGTLDPSETGYGLGTLNGCSGIRGDGPHQALGRSRSTEPMLLYDNLPNDTQLLSSLKSSSRKSRETVARTSMSQNVETDGSSINHSFSDNGLVNAELTAMKCGRKPKSQRLLSESPGPLQEEQEPDLNSNELVIGLPKEQYKPQPSQSRAATNEMPAKLTSPEYATKKHETKKHEQNSPIKQPSSELNLSDEAFIGLPKENYKPRPSRSRSKRTIMEDEGTTQPGSVEAAAESPISSAVIPDATDATPVKKPKKPAKKTKVKRAKTSAEALLKKSEAMLSDGEDDVLWLETKPSEVKLDLPPDIKREVDLGRKETLAASSGSGQIEAAAEEGVIDEKGLGMQQQDEDTNAASQSADAATASSNDVIVHNKTTDTTHIVVHVPPRSNSHAQIEPKKRGRKKKAPEVRINESSDLEEPSHDSEASDIGVGPVPEDATAPPAQPMQKKRGRKKKVVDVPTETEDVDENTAHESDASPLEATPGKASRPALAEKDLNLAMPPHINSSKYTSSDFVDGSPSREKEDRVDTAAAHLETPHKRSSKDADSVKGVTKHSPINPSGGKALYRVGLSKRAMIPPLLKIVRKDIDKPNEKQKPKRTPERHVPAEDEE